MRDTYYDLMNEEKVPSQDCTLQFVFVLYVEDVDPHFGMSLKIPDVIY